MPTEADILDLAGWRTEEQLLDLLWPPPPFDGDDVDAGADHGVAVESSRWCGESLLLPSGEDSANGLQQSTSAVEGTELDEDNDDEATGNCAWYPCRNAPSLTNFYSCVKSQLYSKSDPSLLLRTRPVLVCVSDLAAVDELVSMVAKDATVLSTRPLIQASLDLVRALTCVYRRRGDVVVLDNHSVTMVRADYDANGDLVGIRYDVPWLLGYGALCREGLDFSAYCFFYSLMENATEAARGEYSLDDADLATSMAFADVDLAPERMKRLNASRSLSEDFQFSDEHLDFVHRCAAAALNLKLVRVVPDPGKPKKCVQFVRHANLERAARLLGLDPEALRREVTIRYEVMRDGHRKALRNRTADECNAALDGMARALYWRLIQFVVAGINESLAVGRLGGGTSAPAGRLTLLVGPSDPLRACQRPSSSSSSTALDAFDFELNCLCDLLGCLRALLTSRTPLGLLAADGIRLPAETLTQRDWPEAPGPPDALVDGYRSLGSPKSPTLLGVAFGGGGSDEKTAKLLAQSATPFRLVKPPGKMKQSGGGDWTLEVTHWLGVRTYKRSALATLAPSDAEAASVFLASSAQLLIEQQRRARQRSSGLGFGSGALTTHSWTQLTALLTDPAQLDFAAGPDADADAAAVKLLFVERLPARREAMWPAALLTLRSCQLAAVKACQLFQCSASRHSLLAAFGEVALPYTTPGLGACQAGDEGGSAGGGSDDVECDEGCFKSGHYLKRVAKRYYDGPVLIGRRQIFCHYRHLLALYRARAGLTKSAVVLQSHARGLAARRMFRGLKAKADAYGAELRAAMQGPLCDGSQDRLYDAIIRSLTADVWRANWSLIESHLPKNSGDGAGLLPDANWAELLAFSRGCQVARVPLSGQSVLVRCGGGGDADDLEIPEVEQVVDVDVDIRGDLVLSHCSDRSVCLTRLTPSCPAWCWGYWNPEAVACGRRAVELGASDYPVGEQVPVFDSLEWVAHLCQRLHSGVCRVQETRLRCAVPLIVGGGGASVGLLAAAPLWLLVVNHAELRNLAAVGGGPLNAEVAEALANYHRFGSLEPRRRWAKVHSSQAPMQLSSLLTRLQMLDPEHKAADEAARLRLLSNGRDQSACDANGRRVRWAKQRAKENE